MITTAVFNGIEFRIKPNGAVEIFADRPSEVQIADLQKLLTSFFGNSNFSGSSSFMPLSAIVLQAARRTMS